ncbi:MAG: helix-turn-helix domain-containing protein [bacterium]|nr:helix-turn-helix domain-containing protein [bacterium]
MFDKRNSGNISAIARELGISRNTVYKKLKEARNFKLDA